MSSLTTRTEIATIADADLVHVLDRDDFSSGINGTSKKATLSAFRAYILDPVLIKAAYEINPDTNALTDSNALKLSFITVTEPVNLNLLDGGII